MDRISEIMTTDYMFMKKRKRSEDKISIVSTNNEWESKQQRRRWVENRKNYVCNWCNLIKSVNLLIYYNQYYPTSLTTKPSNQYLTHYEAAKRTRRIGIYIRIRKDDDNHHVDGSLLICSTCLNIYKHKIDEIDEQTEKRWIAIKSDISFIWE